MSVEDLLLVHDMLYWHKAAAELQMNAHSESAQQAAAELQMNAQALMTLHCVLVVTLARITLHEKCVGVGQLLHIRPRMSRKLSSCFHT